MTYSFNVREVDTDYYEWSVYETQPDELHLTRTVRSGACSTFDVAARTGFSECKRYIENRNKIK